MTADAHERAHQAQEAAEVERDRADRERERHGPTPSPSPVRAAQDLLGAVTLYGRKVARQAHQDDPTIPVDPNTTALNEMFNQLAHGAADNDWLRKWLTETAKRVRQRTREL